MLSIMFVQHSFTNKITPLMYLYMLYNTLSNHIIYYSQEFMFPNFPLALSLGSALICTSLYNIYN